MKPWKGAARKETGLLKRYTFETWLSSTPRQSWKPSTSCNVQVCNVRIPALFAWWLLGNIPFLLLVVEWSKSNHLTAITFEHFDPRTQRPPRKWAPLRVVRKPQEMLGARLMPNAPGLSESTP